MKLIPTAEQLFLPDSLTFKIRSDLKRRIMDKNPEAIIDDLEFGMSVSLPNEKTISDYLNVRK